MAHMPFSTLLVAAVAGLLAALTNAQPTFPYCNCERFIGGPYYLQFKSRHGGRYCYTVYARDLPNGTCSKFDLRKIEIDTQPRCAGSLWRVRYRGKNMSASVSRYTQGSTTKITLGGVKLLDTFKRIKRRPASLCFTLMGECKRLKNFCTTPDCNFAFFNPENNCCPFNVLYHPPPPPPSPPPPRPPPPPPPPAPKPSPIPSPVGIPPQGFPYCECNKVTRYQPYTVSAPTSNAVLGGVRYCFDIQAQELPSSLPCTGFDLKKIEMNINRDCIYKADAVTFNGVGFGGSYNKYSKGRTTFKVTKGGPRIATFSDLVDSPASLCFTLPDSCPLNIFCKGACSFSFFSYPTEACCPIVTIASNT